MQTAKLKLVLLSASPRKSEVSQLNVFAASEEEDTCPICLEEYDTKCEHHLHLSCILEWNERSESCPICAQVTILVAAGRKGDNIFWQQDHHRQQERLEKDLRASSVHI